MVTKKAELKKLLVDARALRTDLETRAKGGEDIPAEDAANLQKMIDDGIELKSEIEREENLDEIDQFVNHPVSGRQTRAGMQIAPVRKSWGQTVIESKQFEIATKPGAEKMERVDVKALHGLTDATGGVLVQTMRDPELIGIPMQPRSILDLITIAQTGSSAVEFARLASRTNNAAVTLEFDVSGGDFNLKPESDLTFELITATVKTIPTYVAASRNILADAPQLRSLIDQELTYMVRLTLENQVLNGDGASPNFTGILQTSGIQTRTQQSTTDRGGLATDTMADALRRAITDVQLSFYEVTGIMLNPGDGEAIELEKTSEGSYINLYDPVGNRLWRIPVVETSLIAVGTALVGNYRLGATLWDRQATDIRVGEPGMMFLQNAVAVLAELRAAFAVKRPAAFERVTFV